MNTFRKTGLLLLLLGLMPSIDAFAFNTYKVGEDIVGKKYNEVWKRWAKRTFRIWAGISEEYTEYIFFEGDTGLGNAIIRIENTKEI